MTTKKMIKVTQIRSRIGRSSHFKSLLSSVGLGKIGDTQELPDIAAIRGTLRKLASIVEIKESK